MEIVNRKAHHDYFVKSTYEAGIELMGTEIKLMILMLELKIMKYFL